VTIRTRPATAKYRQGWDATFPAAARSVQLSQRELDELEEYRSEHRQAVEARHAYLREGPMRETYRTDNGPLQRSREVVP
jgi:hypothetical protein